LSGLVALALVCLAVVALAAAAAAAPGPQVNLKITAGSVTANEGRLKGSASVGNSGPAVTRRFFVDLIVQLPGTDRRLRRTGVERLGTGASKIVHYNLNLPTTLPIGRHQVWACPSHSGELPQPSLLIGCRELGGVYVPVPRLIPTPAAPAPATPTPQQPPAPPAPSSSPTAPTAPLSYEAGVPMVVNEAGNNYYWADVPASYDRSSQTPTTLLVWLPGCGQEASQEINMISPSTVGTGATPRDWMSITVGEHEDECWDPNTDTSLVTSAIADVETHFNVDRHRVILGGYGEGGNVAYRLAFDDADQFAGLLAENTSPFRDTGSTQSASLAAAAWKFPVVHLAHLEDGVFPIAGVRNETNAMISAGFPLTRIEVDGGFYDEPGETENGHSVPGTDADVATYLLPHIDDGWRSP
jgi:predicted esterase